MIRNLRRTVTHIGHMAVGTGNAASCMNPLAPQFEFGVLRLKYLRASFFVDIIKELSSVRECVSTNKEVFSPRIFVLFENFGQSFLSN